MWPTATDDLLARDVPVSLSVTRLRCAKNGKADRVAVEAVDAWRPMAQCIR